MRVVHYDFPLSQLLIPVSASLIAQTAVSVGFGRPPSRNKTGDKRKKEGLQTAAKSRLGYSKADSETGHGNARKFFNAIAIRIVIVLVFNF